jgi:hypothetical protein
MAKRQWSELSLSQRRLIYLVGAAEVAMTGMALRDLERRPPGGVRGPKRFWALACVVQPVGPIAYLAAGRR